MTNEIRNGNKKNWKLKRKLTVNPVVTCKPNITIDKTDPNFKEALPTPVMHFFYAAPM